MPGTKPRSTHIRTIQDGNAAALGPLTPKNGSIVGQARIQVTVASQVLVGTRAYRRSRLACWIR